MNPTNHWKLGLFVVLSLALGFGAIAFFGAQRLNRESFEVVTYFDESVEGLGVGSPVKYRGVQFGRVTDITFAPNHKDVQVTSEVFVESVRRLGLGDTAPESQAELALGLDGFRLQIARSGITGVAFLQADIFDSSKVSEVSYDFEIPWNFIPSQPSTLRSIEVGLQDTLTALPALLNEATRTMQDLDGAIENARLDSLSGDLSGTLLSAQALFADLRKLDVSAVTEETVELLRAMQSSVNGLDQRIADVGETLASFDALVGTVESELVAADLPETTKALRGVADELGSTAGEGNSLASELRQELRVAGEALASLRRLLDLLERDPSAVLNGRR
ncbi:MAG: MlaD family protein [Planctomycetota bacterium]|jgi:paraquat-inducible protein B